MFWKKAPLAEPKTGERDILATVCIHLNTPLPSNERPNGLPMVGYFCNISFRIAEGDPRIVLESVVSDGKINWDDTEVHEVTVFDLARDIRKQIQAPDSNGVWYRGGRMFFPRDSYKNH
jgi:hypothetical protein